MTLTLLLWFLAAALLVLVGLAGLVVPVLPGAVLVFAGLFLAAWVEDFTHVGTWTLVALGILVALTYALDLIASALGARHFGASPRAVAGAAIGTVIGVFFGIPGILLGPFLGAVIGELTVRGHIRTATSAGVGAFIGFLLSTAGKLALGFAMVGLFLVVRFL